MHAAVNRAKVHKILSAKFLFRVPCQYIRLRSGLSLFLSPNDLSLVYQLLGSLN